MGEAINLFTGTTGLNLVDPPHKLQANYDSGVCELSVAMNVDISNSGMPARRDGFSIIRAGNVSALVGASTFSVALVGTDLVFISEDLTQTVLRSGVAWAYLAALEGRIYINSPGFLAYVEEDGTPQDWSFTTQVDGAGRELVGPPPGKQLCYHRGAMHIVDGCVLYYSEPFAPNVFCLASNYYDFGASILDVFSDGVVLFVVTADGVFSLLDGEQNRILAYPTIPGTMALVDYVKTKQISGVLAMTKKGVVFLTHNSATPIGRDKLDTVAGSIGSAYVTKTHYYCALS